MSDNSKMNMLKDKHARITKELGELQAIEEALYKEMQGETTTAERTNEINTYVTNLVNIRERMKRELGNIFSRTQDNLAYNTGHLENQSTMSTQLKEELRKAKDLLKSLKAEKNNKTRLAQIGEYEFEKNKEHKDLMKTIVYGSFLILIVFFLNKKNIYPDTLTQITVVAIVAVMILLVIQRLYWNFRRDNIDYSKFSQPNTEREVGKKREGPTLKLSKLLGLSCDADINEMAKKMAKQKNVGGKQGFSNMNINTVFPCQRNQCLKYSHL